MLFIRAGIDPPFRSLSRVKNGIPRPLTVIPCLIMFAACDGDPHVEKAVVTSVPPAPLSEAVSPGDWPQWRGPRNDGVSTETDFDPLAVRGMDNVLAKGHPRLIWKINVGWGYAGTAIVGEYVYTMGFSRERGGAAGKDTVFCLKEATGETVWAFSYACAPSTYTGPRAFPLVHEGRVYTLSWDGRLYCLDALTGREIWLVDVEKEYGLEPREQEFGFCSPPALQGDILLVNARSWGVALDKRTGRRLWASPAGMSGYAPPVPFRREGVDYTAVFGATKLYVVASATGRLVDSFDWKTAFQGNIADPLVLEDGLFITSSYGRGYGRFRFDGKKLSLVYRLPGLGAQMAPGVIIDGYYYGNDYYYFYAKGENRCIEIATGKTMWTRKLGQTSVTAVGAVLLILSESGELITAAATPRAYKPLASGRLGTKRKGEWFSPPVFSRSRLYVRNYHGDLLCLDMGKKP